MRILDVKSVLGKDTLVGKSQAEQDLPQLERAVMEGPPGETIVWDWSRIRIVTASYLLKTCVQLFKRTLSGELDKFFVMSGMNDNSAAELKLVLEAESLVMLVAEGAKGKRVESPSPWGKLDQSYAEAFAEAARQGMVSAGALHQSSKSKRGPGIGKTAWINRLSNLYQARLLRRKKIGREFVYELPV